MRGALVLATTAGPKPVAPVRQMSPSIREPESRSEVPLQSSESKRLDAGGSEDASQAILILYFMVLERSYLTSFPPGHVIVTDSAGDCIQILQGPPLIDVGYGLGIPCFVIRVPFSESAPPLGLSPYWGFTVTLVVLEEGVAGLAT